VVLQVSGQSQQDRKAAMHLWRYWRWRLTALWLRPLWTRLHHLLSCALVNRTVIALVEVIEDFFASQISPVTNMFV